VWVGRSYDIQKDADLFLEALGLLPSHEGLLVDADPRGESVRGRLDKIGRRVRHRSLLEPSEMADIYREAAASGGALISTSRWEGFPLAVAEAMACACPIVASQVPGHEHLVDGENAMTYDRGAGAAAVAHAVRRLDDHALRQRIVSVAHRQAETEWTSKRMADAYFDLYQRALASTQPPRLERMTDPVARSAWRVALRGRPHWHRVRALVHD
jgi:glycosyltransferase involved in cell wall biosynthesis